MVLRSADWRMLLEMAKNAIVAVSALALAQICAASSEAMTVSEAITVLEAVHPASAATQTIKVNRSTMDVTSLRGDLEFNAHVQFSDLDDDRIIYHGQSAKTRRTFAFLVIYCKLNRECVQVISDGKWALRQLLIETNTLEADRVKNAIRTLIWLNQ